MYASDSFPTCIWCTQSKPTTAFNREHVIPESFGLFESGFTLINTVCTACNDFFSRELELALARDSFEGYQRYHYGQKRTSEFGVAPSKPDHLDVGGRSPVLPG